MSSYVYRLLDDAWLHDLDDLDLDASCDANDAKPDSEPNSPIGMLLLLEDFYAIKEEM